MAPKNKNKQLYVFYREQLVGTLFQTEEELLQFSYDSTWVDSIHSFPLAPTLPLQKNTTYGNVVTRAYFENLLPEGTAKDRINAIHRDIAKDAFRFLEKFGEDCAGAFIITSDASYPKGVEPDEVEEVHFSELDSIIDKEQDLGSFIHKKHHGRFSLAGAQDKIAIIYHDGKLYIPTKGGATTHILKPIIKRFNHGLSTVLNEHFCMTLAKKAGLNVAQSDIVQSKYPYYIVDRYDRHINDQGFAERLHQFDFCQGQGYSSGKKYEDDGGPTLEQNFSFIKGTSALPAKDLDAYADWLVFNIIIGNNDSHSKNISFLYRDGELRLAPFYDLLSTAVYRKITGRFAFGFGKNGQKQYFWYKLQDFHLENTSKKLSVHRSYFSKKMLTMCDKIDDCLIQTQREIEQKHSYRLTRMTKLIHRRIALMRSRLGS
ncbi:type II toxin-antitoxin system HipA family toxin [Bdellovibrio bacteriovorus]|uniref:type II toxin-antitoxin system HipA family toxin n=1 Tax=Bdellovibrio TaxID=958 RepID=UPI0035A83ECE